MTPIFRNRVRWRLTVWYAASLALICAVFSTCVFLYVRASEMFLLRAQIDKEFTLVEKAIRLVDRRGDERLVGDVEAAVPTFRIVENGRIRFTTRGWASAGLALDAANVDYYRIEISAAGRHYYVHGSEVAGTGQAVHIDIAEDIEQAYARWRKLAFVLLIGLPGAVLASLAGGYMLAGRTLRPVGSMARKAHEISADKLSERLPVHDADDEFGRLALAFNDTLERLERSFERQRRFTADASHELRTPLAIIRSIGENALQPPSDAARHADAIGRILEEADRLTRLLDGLLTLTRAEAGQFPLRMEELDLASLCREVGECMQVLAEEKNQHMLVEAPHPVHVTADGAAIKLALLNLVSNAIRYTPAQGKIAICSCVAQDDHAVIEVRDNGPGIAPEHHVMIFERFYRVDPDRSRETGGVGLGLAIAKWAVNLNGGRIELESEVNAGSLFRIRMLLSSVSKGK